MLPETASNKKLPALRGKLARVVREYHEDEEGLWLRQGCRLWWLRENRKEYRKTHETFEAFVQDYLGVTARRAEQLIDAAQFYRQIEAQNANENGEIVRIEAPKNEWQMRPLIQNLDTDGERIHVLRKAQEKAKTEGVRMTAKIIEAAVDEFLADPDEVPPLPEVEVSHGIGKAHVSKNTGENEWYTPPEIIEAARYVLDGFDLDPATSEVANKTVAALQIYTEKDNGLDRDWPIGTIWMNPPYAQPLIGQFAKKFAQAIRDGSSGIVLVNNATETVWFQEMASVCAAICFPKSRIRFVAPDGTRGDSPLQGQAIIYCGDEPDKFQKAFSDLGMVLRHE